jgi:predicted secreted Zn-dependent protease
MKLLPEKKLHTCLVLFVFIAVSVFKTNAQNLDTTGRIIPNGKLEWKYFTGQVDTNSTYWANTHCNINYRYIVTPSTGDTAKIILFSWAVLKNDSWIKPDRESDELLEHEQGHLNFAMACSLEFAKTIRNAVLLKTNYKQKIDSVFKAILGRYNRMEVQYDTETNHMFNRIKQAEWNKTLETMLITFK